MKSLAKGKKKREWLTLEAGRFTSATALAREVLALLESSSYRVTVLFHGDEMFEPKDVYQEWDGVKLMSRVKVREMVGE